MKYCYKTISEIYGYGLREVYSAKQAEGTKVVEDVILTLNILVNSVDPWTAKTAKETLDEVKSMQIEGNIFRFVGVFRFVYGTKFLREYISLEDNSPYLALLAAQELLRRLVLGTERTCA